MPSDLAALASRTVVAAASADDASAMVWERATGQHRDPPVVLRQDVADLDVRRAGAG